MIPFVRENVVPGATIRTDGSAIYGPLPEDGFGHEPFVPLGSKIPAHMSLPGVHRVISLLKRNRPGLQDLFAGYTESA
ncbi:MAG: transposase, partial [Burkholderiales bacterium]|nr:transposase [Burkholderiales bacterium]